MGLIFDGHLDLAMNALQWDRDQTLSVAALRDREQAFAAVGQDVPMVSLPAMREANVALCTTTLIARVRPQLVAARDRPRRSLDFANADMAHAAACGQLAYYEALEQRGEFRILRDRHMLLEHADSWKTGGETRAIGAILTIEGADPILDPAKLHAWHDRGARTLMLAHARQGRYAYGTPAAEYGKPKPAEQGGLTMIGKELLAQMKYLGMPLDLTHLCDKSLREALDVFDGPIYSSHSNCRALVPGARQLTDEQITAIIRRDGIVGIALHTPMLRTGSVLDLTRGGCGLEDVADHVDHVCELAGNTRHVAIGSDLDGGFGAEWAPRELDSIADLPRLESILQSRGYRGEDVTNVMCDNWLRFYERVLPSGNSTP